MRHKEKVRQCLKKLRQIKKKGLGVSEKRRILYKTETH